MSQAASVRLALLVCAALALAAIVIAFFRGNYLLGVEYGIAYVFVTAGLIWLFLSTCKRNGRISIVRLACVTLFAIPVGYALAFPASINRDVQIFIDKEATDRQARAELARVFASNVAYGDLSVSSNHLKVINITVRGQLETREELAQLQSRTEAECPTASGCVLHWEIFTMP